MKTIVQLVEKQKEYILEKDKAAKQAVEANIAPVEADPSSASRAYVVGEQLFLNDVLYDVTSPISVGDAIVVNTNITAANKLSADIQSKQDQIEVTTMPTASASNVGKVLIYIGATTSTYTSGQSYQSTLEGGNYIWKPTSISSVDASDVVYDNQTSGLTATDSQAAIDELASQNQTLTSAFVNNVNVNGSKNLFVFDIESLAANTENDGSWNGNTYTKNGMSITINDDNMVFSGTPTNNSGIHVLLNGIPKASYMLSGLAECTNVAWGNVVLKKNGTQVTNISHFNKADWNLDLSSYDYDSVDIEIKREQNNVAVSGTLYPMLSLKTDYDLDNTWVAPSKTNHQLTQDSVTWDDLSEVGAVNLLNHNAHNMVLNGITFTVNPDRSVTANGTATAEVWLGIAQNVVVSESARASGCPKGGTPSTYFMTFSQGGNSYREYGDGVIVPSGTIDSVYMVIKPNATVDIVFKPMISPVSYNGPYVPYAKTNRELTEDVASIEAEMVKGGGYVYKVTSYFKHITITLPSNSYGLVKLFTQHGEVLFSSTPSGIVANTLNTQKVLLNRTDSTPVWTYTIDGASVAFDLVTSATAIIFSTVPLEITAVNESTPETNTMGILNLALLSNS